MTDLSLPWRWAEFGGEPMLVGVPGARVILCASRKGAMYTRDPASGILRQVELDDPRMEFLTTAANTHHELVAALRGVVNVADRATVEFDRARAILAKVES